MNFFDDSEESSSFNALFIVFRAKGGRNQRLRLAACEQARPVRARQNAHLDFNLADLIEFAAIRTAPVFQHLVAENPLFQCVEYFARFRLLLVR